MTLERPSHTNPEQTEFLLDIIDDRHRTLDLLKEKYTEADARTAGYQSRSVLLPPMLTGFVDTKRETDVTIDSTVERTRNIDEKTCAIHLKVMPEDSQEFTLADEQHLVTVQQNGTLAVDDTCLRATLKSLFSHNTSAAKLNRLNDLQLLDIILSLSPVTRRYHKFEDDTEGVKVTIEAISEETADDSTDSLSIEILRPHASGASVGTRLVVHESLRNRLGETRQGINHSVDIVARYNELAAQDVLTVEQMFEEDSRFVPVQAITRYHMSDIYDALDALDQYGLNASDSG